MRTSLINSLIRFARDESGTSVIEFALFAPILCVTLMGVTDVSMAYSRKLAVEQAVFRALERVTVGTVQSDYDYLKAEAAAADGAGGIVEANVTVTPWRECDRVVQPTYAGTCPANQLTSKYVRVAIATTYTPMFFEGPLASIGNSNGIVPIDASAAVRIQ